MSAKPDSWMPFYIGKYLADTLHLTTEQHGAYLLLLAAAWMRRGKLPNDDAQLMRIARCDKAAWKRVKTDVMAFFVAGADGLTQKRLAVEYAKALTANTAQHENGKKGGRPKKAKPNPTETHGFSGQEPKSNPTESPLQIQREEAKDQKLKATVRQAELRADFDAFYQAYPRKQAKADALKAWKQVAPGLAEVLPKLAEQRAHDDGWLRGFIPLPATYLRGQRWKDELTKPTTNGHAEPAKPIAPPRPEETPLERQMGWLRHQQNLGLITSDDFTREATAARAKFEARA